MLIINIFRVCYAHEVSTVDPKNRVMTMQSKNLSFCNVVTMEENLTYRYVCMLYSKNNNTMKKYKIGKRSFQL